MWGGESGSGRGVCKAHRGNGIPNKSVIVSEATGLRYLKLYGGSKFGFIIAWYNIDSDENRSKMNDCMQ